MRKDKICINKTVQSGSMVSISPVLVSKEVSSALFETLESIICDRC